MERVAWQATVHWVGNRDTIERVSTHTKSLISVDGLLGCFYVLDIMNSAVVNFKGYISFQIMCFF